METITPEHLCNICGLKKAGGDSEKSCLDHYQILGHLWNALPDYKMYSQFLINKKRQQAGLHTLEFPTRPKQFGEV